ncbi:hypothetical protein, partial [Allosphingosinicella sp.]|uniref:hypothetical protein n=1 Tax=Allosphingosinicella sp. TaxID=2823234 RepID=UPI002FC26B19
FMSISMLAARQNQTRSRWSFVDTSMFIRAVSIVLVVAGHFKLLDYTGGATSALFLISGFLFGGFQLTEAFSTGSSKPMMRLFIKVLVPTVLFSSALLFTKVLLDKPAHISTLLLYSNFVSPYMVGNDFYLWYVVSTAEQNPATRRRKSRPLGGASGERREGVARPEFPACGVGDFGEGFSLPFGRGFGRDGSFRRSSRGC